MNAVEKNTLMRSVSAEVGCCSSTTASRSGRYRRFWLNPKKRVGQTWAFPKLTLLNYLGVSVRTLQDWDQGSREPLGAAAVLTL